MYSKDGQPIDLILILAEKLLMPCGAKSMVPERILEIDFLALVINWDIIILYHLLQFVCATDLLP
jgi:hypothetical protein